MSKSENVVNPDDVIKEYGADTLRLYEMFMDLNKINSETEMIEGSKDFRRVWRMYYMPIW